MRIVMMGTGPFAVPSFRSLLASQHDVPVLVTRPARPVPGKKGPPPNPMREVAQAHGLPVLDPIDVNADAARETVAAFEPQLLVVCDYGQILSPQTLALAPLGGINLHGSLLPKYRGAAPVNWAILRGETESGVTVIHMTPGLDAGPCLCARRTPIQQDEDAGQLESRLAVLGVDAIHEAIEMLAGWDGASELGEVQQPALATKAPRLKKSDGRIDWERSATSIANQVRGLKPWPGTYTFIPGGKRGTQRVIVDAVDVTDTLPAKPGEIIRCGAKQLHVATGTEAIAILRLQPAGKRMMSIEEYLRGNPLHVGQSLTDA